MGRGRGKVGQRWGVEGKDAGGVSLHAGYHKGNCLRGGGGLGGLEFGGETFGTGP